MDALTQIRAKINDFQGYTSEEDISRSDEMIRAYVGERLAALSERLSGQEPEAFEDLSPVMTRAEFTNQRVLQPLQDPKLHPLAQDGLLQADLNLMDVADAAESVDAPHLKEYAAKVAAAFDARDGALMQLRGRA